MTDHNRNSDLQRLSSGTQQLAREVLAHHLKHNLCLSEEGDRELAGTTARNLVAAFVALEAVGQQSEKSMPDGLDFDGCVA